MSGRNGRNGIEGVGRGGFEPYGSVGVAAREPLPSFQLWVGTGRKKRKEAGATY